MNDLAMQIQHAKLRGEWAELRFMACAAERGLAVAKPWGDSAQYDFSVEHHGHFLRVQVKSTMARKGHAYYCTLRGNGASYDVGAFDFLAAYVIPEDAWYIIPGELVFGHVRVLLYPHKTDSRYGQYEDAWDLLKDAAQHVQMLPTTPSGCPAPGPESGPTALIQLLHCTMCARWPECYGRCAESIDPAPSALANTPPAAPPPCRQ